MTAAGQGKKRRFRRVFLLSHFLSISSCHQLQTKIKCPVYSWESTVPTGAVKLKDVTGMFEGCLWHHWPGMSQISLLEIGEVILSRFTQWQNPWKQRCSWAQFTFTCPELCKVASVYLRIGPLAFEEWDWDSGTLSKTQKIWILCPVLFQIQSLCAFITLL